MITFKSVEIVRFVFPLLHSLQFQMDAHMAYVLRENSVVGPQQRLFDFSKILYPLTVRDVDLWDEIDLDDEDWNEAGDCCLQNLQ